MAKKSIGEANVKLTVDGAEDVASKLKDVKSELDATADAGDAAGGSIDGAFKNAGETIKGATGGVGSFARSLSGVLGIVSALTAAFAFAFGAIIRNIKDATEAQDKQTESVKATREAVREQADEYVNASRKVIDAEAIREDAARRIVQLSKESQKAEEELNTLLGKRASLFQVAIRGRAGVEENDRIAADEARKINERLAREVERIVLERNRRLEELAQEQTRIAEEASDREKQIVEQLERQLETIRIAGLDGIDQADAQYQQRRADRERAHQQAVEEGRQREADLLDAIDRQDAENTRNAIQRIRDQERAREEADKQRAAQQQKRDEQEAQRKLEQALRELQRAVQESTNAYNRNTQTMERLVRDQANFTRVIERVGDGIRK